MPALAHTSDGNRHVRAANDGDIFGGPRTRTKYTYDGLDRVSVVTDPDGRKVKTEYFGDGQTRVITKAYQSANMTPIVYATYALTPNGQVDTVTDANGNVTNLDYDGFDRLARTFYPDPGTGTPCAPALPHTDAAPSCGSNQKYEQLGYDDNGNVTSKRNRSGKTITFGFDVLNRETSRDVLANANNHYARTLATSYDLAGRKYDVTVTESPLAAQTLKHRYDNAGRLDYVDDTWLGTSNNRVDSGYDAAGNRTTMTWPGGGSLSYTFDALNRMDTVTDKTNVPNLQLANYDWDPLSRKDYLTLNAAAFTTDFVYEDDDDLSSIAHSAPNALTFTLVRNDSSQITSLTASDSQFLSHPTTTGTDTYVPDHLNRIASVDGTTFGYDTNGNVTSDGTYTFEYDEENRLRSAVGAGKNFSYEYDPLGRRRAKIDNSTSTTTKYVSDGQEEIEERDGSNAVLRRYAYGPVIDDRIAMYDAVSCASDNANLKWCFYQVNWQGSTVKLINQDETIEQKYHYGPYGERVDWTPTDSTTGNPFRYTGRRFDSETELYYYRARYYSPKLGRFLQPDPIGMKDDINLYTYTGNDPLDKTDELKSNLVYAS